MWYLHAVACTKALSRMPLLFPPLLTFSMSYLAFKIHLKHQPWKHLLIPLPPVRLGSPVFEGVRFVLQIPSPGDREDETNLTDAKMS